MKGAYFLHQLKRLLRHRSFIARLFAYMGEGDKSPLLLGGTGSSLLAHRILQQLLGIVIILKPWAAQDWTVN